MSSILSAAPFHSEEAAYAYVEAKLWPNGPVCFHCGGTERISKMGGKSTRPGLYKCYACRKPFTVKMGTVLESSHVSMRMWLQAIYLLCSSKKGISTRQLQRTFGCGLKTAWFLGHRVREAMKALGFEPMGGAGATVEMDETYFGNNEVITKRTIRGKPSLSSKRSIVALVERGGQARTFHVDHATRATVEKIAQENVARETEIHTDESKLYGKFENLFAEHHTVVHSREEYVRYEVSRTVHTNSAEGYFSVFKRGMKGVYQHCSEAHLHRYLAEFDFRYNNRIRLGVDDVERTNRAIKGLKGKRLTYQTTREAGAEG
jgi:transposase-like protein